MTETVAESASFGTSKRPVMKPTLHHYGYLVTDIDAMDKWYAKVLGFEVVAAPDNPAPSKYVTNDDVHHRSSYVCVPGVKKPERPYAGVGHVAFAYTTVDDLLESWKRLKEEEGIEPLVLTCHNTHWSFYYKDPDYNNLELMADCWESHEDSLACIKIAYQDNPMGTRVDPEQMIQAREQGASLDEMRERSMRGDFEPAEYLPPSVLF
jgi:catechol 2,3-dioxygenase-like lactoylglutathione lyase family enzyme